ncbi:DNA cytosine methyltransferase [Aliarcobacter butzleri]|uniref:DNA cytosine methyltransferase n=1 Tax=Aliarcobacter butzleri TaxID=28197 RepID=UPI0024DE7E79|nr:DNA (cytosine-5-)-methyltransferase [Aliarcobacter butzleri]MDK2080110.1 DNA (cytosine-5-)-methyltransferase [Aliarcobacter butzleri]
MNVLSLFDGISCAYLALKKLDIPISNYYASEIDKYAIKVSKENNPDIIHLGDVRNIKPENLPKIDLLIGGSPCQDLSNAQKGEGLKGEKSRLFYEYIRIFKEVKPKYFLLENVQNKWGDLMSEIIGVKHITINSSLFSAQSRPRYYWTNIPIKELPNNLQKERIKDIKENNVDEKYFFDNQPILDFLNSIDINKYKTETKEGIIKLFDLPKEVHNDNERQRRVYSIESKSPTILARTDTTKIYDNGRIRKLTPLECERLQKIPDNYTKSCSDTQRYKMIGNAFTVDTIAHILKGINNE